MQMIHEPVGKAPGGVRVVALRAPRLTLAKTRWRGAADDGVEFGFDLARPLRHGDVVHVTAAAAYTIHQDAEPVLEVDLGPDASAAARLGWSLGNLHQPVEVRAGVLVVPDDPAVRALLESLRVPFRAARAVFQPGAAVHAHHHEHHA